MVLLSVDQHLSLWPAIKTLPRLWEIVLGIGIKFSDVNHRFRSLDFRDFLEKHLRFFRYLMYISKYSQNTTR